MKNKLTIGVLALTFVLGSCRKENTVMPEEKNLSITSECKFSRELKIFDKTNNYFVEVTLESNDEQVVNNAFRDYSLATLELVWEKAKSSEKENENRVGNTGLPVRKNNDLIVRIQNPSVGKALGYKITMGDIQANSRAIVQSYGTIDYFLDPCVSVKVTKTYGVTALCKCYVSDGFTWGFERQAYIYNGVPDYFGSAGGPKWINITKPGSTLIIVDIVVNF